MCSSFRTYLLFSACGFLSCLSLLSQTSVLTQHNDLSRTGQNLTESILTPTSVSSGGFGKLFSVPVDGLIVAQPLYMASLSVAGATHNVVFVATEHDSVYAIDADLGGNALWQASLLDSAHGAAAGATTDPAYDTGCYVLNGPEYGITGTPVIDPATGTLYVVSLTYENGYSVQRLHALDIKTGAEKFGGPVTISASLPGTGSGSSGGMVAFDPKWESQRAGLALVNGNVYIGFAAHCDFNNYHGWLFAYNASTLAQTAVFLTSPNGVDSGIWMGAAAPAVDTVNGVNRMFVTTGNGTYDATTPYATNTTDYGDDILRLDLSNGIKVADAFTPLNQAALSSADEDLGSSGALILPDQAGTYPHLLVEASKGGVLYLVNRDNLGGYSTTANNVVQELDGQVNAAFGLPAYWNGNVYVWASGDQLKQFGITNGVLSSTPLAVSGQVEATGVGSTPSISAHGSTGGIVWSLDPNQTTQVLYAHDASNVANLLWSSATKSGDSAGAAIKFAVPTVANGKVYIGSTSALLVYGLPDFALSSSTAAITVNQAGTATETISIAPLYGFTSAVAFTASNLPTGVTASFATSGANSVVTFTATSSATPGTYQVSIIGSAGTQSHSVPVALTLPGPNFTLTSNPTSLSLAAGTVGSTSINVVNALQWFSPNVTFTCSVGASLANVTCSIPGTVTGSGVATLTVTAASSAATPHWRGSPTGGTLIFLGMAGLGCLLLMMGNRKTRLIGAVGVTALAVGLISCASPGNSSNSTNTGPVAETGLITVVGTAGSFSQTITVSVSVH